MILKSKIENAEEKLKEFEEDLSMIRDLDKNIEERELKLSRVTTQLKNKEKKLEGLLSFIDKAEKAQVPSMFEVVGAVGVKDSYENVKKTYKKAALCEEMYQNYEKAIDMEEDIEELLKDPEVKRKYDEIVWDREKKSDIEI